MHKDSGSTADSPQNQSLALSLRAGDGVLLPKVTDAWIDGKLSVRDLIRISNSPIRKGKQGTRKEALKSQTIDSLVRTTRSDIRWWVVVRIGEFTEGLGVPVDGFAKRRQILEMVLHELPNSFSPYANNDVRPREQWAQQVDRGDDLQIDNDPEIRKLFDAWHSGQLTADEVLLTASAPAFTYSSSIRVGPTDGDLTMEVWNVSEEIKTSISRSLLTRTALYCDRHDILDTVQRRNVYDAMQRCCVDHRSK